MSKRNRETKRIRVEEEEEELLENIFNLILYLFYNEKKYIVLL